MNMQSATILITGGTAGIGLEMARQLLGLGNTVIVTGRDIKKLEQTKKELPGVYTYQSDVSDPQAIIKLCAAVTMDFPKLNIIVNNAGIMRAVDFNDTDYDKICSEIDTNLNGPIRMAQQFLPHLKEQPEAAIVNVSSGLAFISYPTAPIYSASKIALHTYTKSLRQQLTETNVKVFELAPPKTSKPLLSSGNADGEGNKMPEMTIPDVVKAMIKGMESNKYEILPGMSKVLKFAGRVTL